MHPRLRHLWDRHSSFCSPQHPPHALLRILGHILRLVLTLRRLGVAEPRRKSALLSMISVKRIIGSGKTRPIRLSLGVDRTMDIRSPVWLAGRLWLTITLGITVDHSPLSFVFADVTLASAHRNMARSCQVLRLHTSSSASTMSATFSSSMVGYWATPVTTSTSFCGWFELLKVFNPTRYRNPIISLRENTE